MTVDVAGTRAAIATMMADVARRTGISGRLLVRRDGPSTCMEIYEGVSDVASFERELASAVLRHGLARIAGLSDRHIEVFVAAG